MISNSINLTLAVSHKRFSWKVKSSHPLAALPDCKSSCATAESDMRAIYIP